MKTKVISLILVSVLCLNCSSRNTSHIPEHIKALDSLTVYPADVQPAKKIQLIRELTFGSSEKTLVGNVGGFDVDKRGRIFIADSRKHTIHVFSPDGSYVTHLGQEGRGPGEFVFTPIPTIISNQLYAYDAMSRKMNIYSLDSLMLSHSLNLNPKNQGTIKEIAGFSPSHVFPQGGNLYLFSFSSLMPKRPKLPGQKIERPRLYYFVDENGNILSNKILEQRGRIWMTATIDGRIQRATGFPFMGKSLIALSTENYIFSAWSRDFLIKVYDSNGTYQRAFYYAYKNIPLTEEAAMNSQEKNALPREAIEFRQRVIQQNELPNTWPALHSMLIDDENRLWVSIIKDDFEVYQWWVLDATDGNLLARFTWPRDKAIEAIKNGKLYARETDEETGLEEIVRYDIKMGEQE